MGTTAIFQNKMASRRISRAAVPLFTKTRPAKGSIPVHRSSARCVHQSTRLPAMAASNASTRPTLNALHQPSGMLRPAAVTGSRSIFMLMHYIEEVKGVTQVLDQEEEIAALEFVKFEEKLRQQKGPDAAPSTIGKGSLDTVPG